MGLRRSEWAALAVHRAGMPALLLCGVLLVPGVFQHANYRDNFHWPPGAPATHATAFATWDAQHYLYLAQEGYPRGGPSVAFYPLWPGLLAGLRPAFGGHTLLAALVAAGCLALAAAGLLHAHVAHRLGAPAADATLLIWLTFPTAFFFSLPYTESLFLCLVLGVFRLLDLGRWTWAAAVGTLLPLCRPPGLFIVLPLAFAVHQAWRNGRLPGRHALVLAALPMTGFGAYLLVMDAATGNALAGFAIQSGYVGRPSLLRLLEPAGLWHAFLAVDVLPSPTRSPLDRLFFVGAVAALPWLWRKHRLWFWYALPMTLVPAVSAHFMSFARYAVVVFPAFAAAGATLVSPERRWLLLLVAGASGAAQVLLMLRHALYYWVS